MSFITEVEGHYLPGRQVRRGPGAGGVPHEGWDNLKGGRVAAHDHHETDELDGEAGDFWVQLESRQGDGHILDRNLSLSTSGTVANGTVLTTLLFAYIGYHERLLTHHQCSNPDCRLVQGHQQLLSMLETALEQTAYLLEGCDEAPETEEEEDEAE